jgi:TolB protein
VLQAFNSPENAAWEEEHKTFRHTEGWLIDTLLLHLATGKRTNVTAVERVSNYNSGLFFWPGDPRKLGFTPLINGTSTPFSMDIDGRNKRNLSSGEAGFTYGFEASPDGKRICYHKNYQIVIAAADGSQPITINTGNPFNFAPRWSPDGRWVLFVSGEHYHCHPYLVAADGSGLRKLADRGGYRGVMQFLDVPDYHNGSSDVPTWSRDSRQIFFTAQRGDCVELMQADLDGNVRQLSQSMSNTIHYHPNPSPDGRWLLFGSTRSHGRRQLFVMPTAGGEARQITNVDAGWAAMHAHWRPRQAR